MIKNTPLNLNNALVNIEINITYTAFVNLSYCQLLVHVNQC